MLFRHLCASPALDLQSYVDIDHFRESERYARAESVPLTAREFSVMRASLSLPACRLSLIRTFPRIINGYDFSGRAIFVIPMDEVSSTRVNGRAIGHSLILLKGHANARCWSRKDGLSQFCRWTRRHVARAVRRSTMATCYCGCLQPSLRGCRP